MNIQELLNTLVAVDASIRLENDRLAIQAPKGSISDSLRASLLEHKTELIQFLKSGQKLEGADDQTREVSTPPNLITPESTAITPAILPLISLTPSDIDRIIARVPGGVSNIQDIYALSPLQDGILFHHLLATRGDPYLLVSQLAFVDRGLLDRYLAAVQQVVDRHDILRTAVHWESLSTSAQVVCRQAPLSITEIRLQPDAGTASEQLARRFDPRHYRIDLTQAPLLQFFIARETGSDRWVMLELMHHLIGDHSTLEILRDEVAAMLSGRGSALPPPQPFRNLVAQARLGTSTETHERFFKEMLADIDEPTLPFGLSNVRGDGRGVLEARCRLPQVLNDRLRTQARRLGVSLASLCHLAFGQVLARTSGRESVVFGTLLFGRTQAGNGAGRAMGLFINTLPLRLDLDSTPLEQCVRQTHLRLADLLQHEHASLALAQRCSGVAAPAPLFSALLNYRHNHLEKKSPGAKPAFSPFQGVKWLGSEERTNYPFTLSVEDFGQALGLTAQIVDSLSPERVCDFMWRALEHLAEALETSPQLPVRQLDVLPAPERKLLLHTWNQTQAAYPADQCIHELFEQQVEKTPDAIAVVQDKIQLTYAELNRQANRLAHRLIAAGVTPDSRVALCVDRCPHMVVGLLAVLKAGGAYVPLDPTYPQDRLLEVLNDAKPLLLLIDAVGKQALHDQSFDLPVLAIDQLTPADAGVHELDSDLRASGLTASHLAYVIYTSGSTGKPKGVMVEHRGLHHYLRWACTEYFDNKACNAVVSSPLVFDATVTSLYLPLLTGGQVLLLPVRKEIEMLASLLRKTEQPWLIKITPSHLAILAQQLRESHINQSGHVFVIGGEVLPVAVVEQCLQLLAVSRLINEFGPTETVVGCSIYNVGDDSLGNNIPIGRPIANTRIYLLDAHGQPVPLGAVGELYIGGDGVARGYLNRPELTAERFLKDPFCNEPGGRMYRTGDLARYRPDGNIEFLGRADHQVKIRGFRIEPGEIEARLAAHPLVREAVVLAREDVPGDKRLVAYVTFKEEAGCDAAELREHLVRQLPDYMVPSAFVTLGALPLTPNGKLDRKALPAPDASALVTRAYEAPHTGTEQTLAAIWSELLGVERIGRHDHFFELGGHSLLAVRLLSRLQSVLKVALPLAQLFAQPTLSSLAQAVSRASIQALPAISPVSRDLPLPLSFAQQRLWFLAQLDGVSQIYHIPFGIRLSSDLDRHALRRSLDMIWARHEALRTVFSSRDGQPQASLLPATDGFTLIEHDLRQAPDASQSLKQISAEEAQTSFDLGHGPLIRGRLIRLADNDQVLLITQHHIVSDGWSMGIFINELSTLYRAFAAGQNDPLPPLAIQYPDYAAWQRQWLSGERLQVQADYWRRQLAEVPVLLELPMDRPRPEQQSYVGASLGIRIDAELTQGLKRLSQQHGTTLFMTLLAAWAAVLSRLSSQQDLVIGTPTANRGRQELEGLIGFFVNTLALRIDLSAAPTLAELIARVRQTALDAQDHQDLPFEQVVEIAQPHRSLAHTPLFQVMFAWQNNDRARLDLPGSNVRPANAASETVKFDLELNLAETVHGIAGSFSYATALFDTITIERHCGYFLAVLKAMVADANQSVAMVDLLSASERELLLHSFNQTQATYPTDRCIHELFEQQVEKTPDAIAVVQDKIQLTYAELNRQANRLAHRLIAAGVTPDSRVALCVDRCPHMIVGLLAVLKAGGAYVPLDPTYPQDRLLEVLADAQPVLLLVDEAGRRALGSTVPAELRGLSLDEPLPALQGTDASKEESNPDPHTLGLISAHLAYVIFTSGSTGKPKGVMVEHRALLARMEGLASQYGFSSGDRVLQFASFNFDASVEEIIGSLIGGAALVLRTPQWLDPKAFWTLCEAAGITTIDLPTRFCESICADPSIEIPARVRLAIIGGESVQAKALTAWFARQNHRPLLLNTYGPTEAVVTATAHMPAGADDSACIGRPIANTRIYLLDAHGQPVPLGAVGELYIGGDGVARGYLNRPELTAERFLKDPFCNEPGGRMYRTGDLARYRPDGNIEFLGRADHQVKIRGFRIEPGEIEARLAAHPLVREAVVLAREDVPGDKRLVAYVTFKEEAGCDAAELREHLVRQLPDYMVPSAFVTLGALPLTPNGKLDRKALPAPDASALVTRAYEAPHTGTEQTLAAIWSELLGVERIGRHDHFFELGGHSLLAVRLLSRLQSVLKVALPLAQLFAQPTLSSLAQAVSRASIQALPAISPVSRDLPLPLSFAQQRLWFLAQLDGVSQIYHIPFGIRLSSDLDRHALRRSLDMIWARHEALRTVFSSRDGQPQASLLPATDGFTLIEHDLRQAPDASQSLKQISAEEAQTSFDLGHGPLIRGRLIRLADNDQVLLITQHHIVSDGWSMGIFINELSTLYRAFAAGQNDPLPPLAIQYPDYAAWQRQWLSGERLQVQADYWRRQLAEVPVLLELPMDRPRPEQQSYVGASLGIRIDAELTQGLKRLSQQHGTTLFMTLLAAWAAVLSRLSSQQDLVIGTPTANRGRQELEGLIGFFVNTLALRIDLSAAPTLAELIARVRQTALDAQDHQDLPFEQVVEIAQPHRSLAHTPLFQVMFAWQTGDESRLELPGLHTRSADVAFDTVKFDLALTLAETADGIAGSFRYVIALFDAATIERHRGYFLAVLRAMVADVNQSAAKVDLLSLPEKQLLLHSFNQTQTPYPADRCIHELFEDQVRKAPDAIAVVQDEVQLTYAELNRQANRLAHRLIAAGVTPDSRVALCVDRRPHMVVGLLAILKAGGAFVPLDPIYPRQRLLEILADAQPVLLLIDEAGRQALGDGVPAGLQSLPLNEPLSALPGQDTTAAEVNSDPRALGLAFTHLAYVIYTSGSTGKPKGVMVEHRSLVNYVTWDIRSYYQQRHGGSPTVFSIGFDAGITTTLGALMSGQCLTVLPAGEEIDRLGNASGHLTPYTLLKVTPSHLRLINQTIQNTGGASPTRALMTGGEPMVPGDIAFWQERFPDVRLINHFGPTETTVGCVTFEIKEDVSRWSSIPIGRPIANTRIYLLDAHGQPVPLGAVGELYIGGDGVARGYLNRPELTAERFLKDPFCNEPGGRMYRTGDLARYRPDGNIEFLGRADHQVKIRGFRIEPGEIEARLAAHPLVREAVVLAREDVPGDKRLVAYVTFKEEAGCDAAELREHLVRQLPDYMVPSAFVTLGALPLTPNGKLDRKALPAPDASALVTRAYEAPHTGTEQTLAAIWSELLGVERIGRHDHFFELGGHSLLAVRLLSRLQSVLKVALPLAQLFAQPTLSSLAQAVSRASIQALPAISPVSRDLPLPLSFAQQRLWFLAQLNGVSQTYHMPFGMQLSGPLDDAAWQRSLNAIWARHEALRTVFTSHDGQPQVSLLAAAQGFTLIEHDLRQAPDASESIKQITIEEAQAPFDLSRGPLIRGRLIRLAAEEHVFLFTQHHIVSDGWSMGIFINELSTLYRAFAAGQNDPLPPLAIQYPDYAAWQRQWLSGERLQVQADYWRRQLAEVPVLLELPMDRPRPEQQSYVGASLGIRIDAELTQGLKRLSQQHGTTLFMTLLAAWAAVLSRLSSQQDLVIGTPTANRGRQELEGLIGFFVNTLALRIDLSAAPTLAELIARVRQTALDAQDHQDLPFEQVVEIAQPHRSLAHTPLFQVMFAWQNNDRARLDLPGSNVRPANAASETVKFDLELNLAETVHGIAGSFSYATALFDTITIERHCGYFLAVLKAMVADANQSVAMVDLLSASERELLLHSFNQTQATYPTDRCIHELFEQQVEKTPDAIAVVQDKIQLTYAELNRQANRLAHRLIAAGVTPDSRVALCVDRCPHMIVGLLAVLKAGGAYVPLDPTYPQDRLLEVLADAQPVLLLVDEAGRRALGSTVPAELRGLSLDEPLPALQGTDASKEESNPDPHTLGLISAHLAYVIFTSGSTGKPKGVMVEHRALLARMEGLASQYGFSSGDRVLQFASFNFDASVEEIIGSLIGGAALVLRTPQWLDPKAFWTLCEAAGITTIDLPTRFCESICADPSIEIPARVRLAIIGGESVQAKALTAWFARQNHRPLLLNTYGPTEAVVTATAHMPAGADDSACIGRPIANTRIYLLDAHGQPVPLGAVGELYIGGDGVARGYLNRPELTAERFLKDPFCNEPGGRMYRTGDLARYRPDGNIEFLGRADHQVKIRGFRIEPGEIEARLAAHPLVREAVVLAREDVPGDKRLVAYVTFKEEAGCDAAELREHLVRQLPDYMVPSAFVTLGALPLTPNGKLDRKALPAPDASALVTRAYEAPHTGTEQTLAAIWSELLGVERIGRHDHFFELGGHSLLAVRLLSRLQSVLKVALPLAQLFAQPTLSSLAQAVSRASIQALPAISPVSRDLPLPLSFAQQRLWFLAQLDGVSQIYHIPFGIRLSSDLDRHALRRSLDMIWARHEALRTVFSSRDGQPQASLLPATDGFTLIEHDLRQAPDASQSLKQISAEEAQTSFDLGHGPLIRGRLIRLADNDQVLLITQHHIVSDGWSMGIFINELSTLYRAFAAGQNDPLPPLAIQYPDYAAWQRQWLSGERLQVQADYWRRQLAEVPVLLELPMDRPRPEQQSYVGASLGIRIDAELTQGLKRLSQQHGTTLFMTLLAAWAAVLSRLSSQQDLVIGTPTANRGRQELEGLIGFFVNTLALRIDLSAAPTLAELIARVRQTALDAQDHQDLPFEQVVEIAQPHRSLAHTPLFQVMFAWQNNDRARLDLPGSNVRPANAASETVKFDLELNLAETVHGIAGSFSYATALFDTITIERHCGYFLAVLKAMVADANQSVAMVDLLSASERELLLHSFNQTQATYPTDRCIHELFEQQVEKTPDAIAVVQDKIQLTYAELNRQANRLAHRLIAAGVTPDSRVALCVDRCPHMIVGLLAVLKAGGAYVPLDPTYPTERLLEVLSDSRPVLLLADATGYQALHGQTLELPVLALEDIARQPCTDQSAPFIKFENESNPDPRALGLTPGHLAYVIYTSGSTGKPKGVMVEHAQIARLLEATQAWYQFNEQDTWCLFHSFAFDFSVWEMWGALRYGGRLVIVSRDTARSAPAFYRLVCENRVTVLNQTPSAFRVFIEAQAQDSSPNYLRYVIFGGEALEPSILKPWYAAHSDTSPLLVNMYGITETTVHVTYRPLQKADTVHSDKPIGQRIPDLRIYLLDTHQQPVPMGAAGELYIGGDGVARGYLNRPELTAERFLSDPFSNKSHARMYRTGDLARYRTDGNLEFLGRADQQVKVRGFRIEPGEIEARLAAHPVIREAVVLAREDVPGDMRLVAYVTFKDEATCGAVELRGHLARQLPDYMVPSAFVTLDTLPLTPNGKLDRKALPAPDASALVTRTYEAPQGQVEQTLAAIWSELLGVDRVGRNDHFFELGGHSMLAVQFVAMAKRIDLNCKLHDLFAHPVLKGLAHHLIAQSGKANDSHPIPVRRNMAQGSLFFVPDGTGDHAYVFELAHHLDVTLPIYVLPWPSTHERPARTVTAMAARMVALIRTVQPQGPYRLAGYSSGGLLAYAIAQHFLGLDENVSFVGLIDVWLPNGGRAHPDRLASSIFLDAIYRNAPQHDNKRVDDLRSRAHRISLPGLIEETQRMGLIPAQVDNDAAFWERAADYSNITAFHRPLPLTIPIHMFFASGTSEGIAPEGGLADATAHTTSAAARQPDPTCGWDQLMPSSLIRSYEIPGDHYSMIKHPSHRERLCVALSEALAQNGAAGDHITLFEPMMPLSTNPHGAPVFCVPGAGDSVTTFIELVCFVDAPMSFYGLQPRGVQSGQLPHVSVEAAAVFNLAAISTLESSEPLHLIGHSHGGLIAFEMARQLHSQGRPVASLCVIDSAAPARADIGVRDITDVDIRRGFVRAIETRYELSLGLDEAILSGSDFLFLRRLHHALLNLNLMPRKTSAEILHGPLNTYSAARRSSYSPDSQYLGPVRLLTVRDPALSLRDDEERMRHVIAAWRMFAPRLEVTHGPGNHYTLLGKLHARWLARWWLAPNGDRVPHGDHTKPEYA